MDEAARLAAFKDLTQVRLAEVGHMMHWECPKKLQRTWLEFVST